MLCLYPSLEDATKMFDKSHRNVLETAETFTADELFSKGGYMWTAGSTPGSCFVSATSSQVITIGLKKRKAHQKRLKESRPDLRRRCT